MALLTARTCAHPQMCDCARRSTSRSPGARGAIQRMWSRSIFSTRVAPLHSRTHRSPDSLKHGRSQSTNFRYRHVETTSSPPSEAEKDSSANVSRPTVSTGLFEPTRKVPEVELRQRIPTSLTGCAGWTRRGRETQLYTPRFALVSGASRETSV